ncbi:MAG: hypothetical protein LUF86_05535 [Clostridiales bacterium]|nr:hypothetical protein [Clostridiales bacterium]
MKKHAMKKGLSALCMVLALCMTFQSVTLAADVSADTSAASSAVSEEADTTETNETTETAAEETEETEESAEEADTAEEAEAEEEAPAEETDPAESAETDAAEDTSAEDTLTEETEDEADVIVTAQATVSTGWAQSDDATYWTFSYLESSTSTSATQAVDEVLYIPSACTVDATTFKAGYYYFDEDGKLVADGTTSVGVVEALNSSYVCDTSAAASGKLAQVVTTQATGSSGAVTVSSTMSYYTGSYNGLWYYNGKTFTGYLRRTSDDYVWDVEDGEGGTKLTGKMDSSVDYLRVDTGKLSTGDDLWYYNGKVFTGYIRRSSSDYVWKVSSGVGGSKLTGTMSTSKYYLRTDTGTRSKGDGKYYKSGKLYSGVVNSYYYAKGVKQTKYKSCWKSFDSSGNVSSKSSANTYYFNSKGKVYTSCWKNLKRNGTTYRFYFNSDGTLCKNLYKKSSAWKKKATKLVISRGTHTATLYAKYGSSYKIPTKSFVVSTSRSASNFKVGTYKLTSRQSWFTISSTNWWYKWATYISGSGSWCHSEQYYTKGNSKSLRISSYNDLGTNQSKQCIRMQVVNAKLIYTMKGYGSIKTVVLNKSTNKGPFGKMTITDNVDASGKLSGTKGYDPTDPLYT